MKTILVKPYNDLDNPEWEAKYTVFGDANARLVRITARSAIEVVVAKVTQPTLLDPQTDYFISSPNFGVAIPGIGSLKWEDFWIYEKLTEHGMSRPDAATVARVVCDLGDF